MTFLGSHKETGYRPPHRELPQSPTLALILTLICTFLAGCGALSELAFPWQAPADRALQEDAIRESIFHYRMKRYKDGGIFFLSINNANPNDAFMARFAGSKLSVKKASESYYKKDPFPGSLRDRSTDEQGVGFFIGAVSWLSHSRVEVGGGMYCGGLCADGGQYRLEKKAGLWTVVDYKIQWVS